MDAHLPFNANTNIALYAQANDNIPQ